MTRRDACWRGAGAVLSGGACAATLVLDGAVLALVLFPVTLLGIVLMVNGKKVATALRAERRGHCHTAAVIHAERVRRHRRRADYPPIYRR